MEFRRVLRVVLAAACTAALIELLAESLRGGGQRSLYFLVSFAISLGVGVLVATLAAALRRPPNQAVAAWVGVASAIVFGPWTGIALGAVTLAAGSHPMAASLRPTRFGLVAGAAFAGSAIPVLWFAPKLPALPGPGWLALPAFASTLVLMVLLAGRFFGAWRTWRFIAPALAIVVLVDAVQAVRVVEAPAHRSRGPHVFVLVLDTVRADALSVYGYARDTTPNLARRVAEHPGAFVHPWAFSNGAWTAPSHATLLTGRLPSEHDVHLGTDTARTMDWSMPTRFTLRAGRTLAERFQAAGYATLAVFANPWLSRIDGLERGFDHYEEVSQAPGLPLVAERLRSRFTPSLFLDEVDFTARAPAIVERLLGEVDARIDRPVFVLANFLDAHAPYRPPRWARGRYAPWSPFEGPQDLSIDLSAQELERLRARYDESIHALDAELEDFFEGLEAREMLGDSWVFVTSDHGEAFAEHGVTDHGTGVYNEAVRVPLVVFPPRGVEAAPAEGPASLASVAAMLAEIAGEPIEGVAGFQGPQGTPHRAIVQFYSDPGKARHNGKLGEAPAQVMVDGKRKLILYETHRELYDLAQDPGERRDLAASEAAEAERLARALPEIDFSRAASARAEDDDALRARLEALGYVE